MVKFISKEKIGIYLSYLMQILIFIYLIWGFLQKNYLLVFEGLFVLIITFFPMILKRKWRIVLPWTLNFLIVFSLYLHASGRLLGLYPLFYPFYDKIGHFIGSVTIALLGFASVMIIEQHSKLRLNKSHIVFFIIIFTLSIGAFWEIFEFMIDKFFKIGYQYSLNDTMYDLIFDLMGGLFIALITHINFKTMKKGIIFKYNKV